MNLKEYNNFLSELSDIVKPLNQILYQILILITLYFLFNNLKYSQTINTNNAKSNNNRNPLKQHKSFIILFIIMAVFIDWFIWNNLIQTTLFISILTIYAYYNFNNLNIISTFVNLTNKLNAAPIITEPPHQERDASCDIPLEIPEILINTNKAPSPFDINSIEIREINEVYKSNKPYVSITDTKYAEIMLNELYNTPQYKNIRKDDIDTTLDNNIQFKTQTNTFERPTHILSETELLNSFRNPKKEFLDTAWLSKRTYNDNCVGCKSSSNKTQFGTNKGINSSLDDSILQNRDKNAICTVIPYGKTLGECTNQDNTISVTQLDQISNNQVNPIEID
jgi:hypothetical protein